MSRERRGLFIADQYKSVAKKEYIFASDVPHMPINLIPQSPPHMNMVEISGGTGWDGTAGAVYYKETLLTIPYTLPYIPELLVYFDAYTFDGSTTDVKAGRYAADVLIYSGASGTVYDVLYAEIVRGELRIVHEFDNDIAGFPIPYTSDANRYKIRIKYYLISKDSGSTAGYNTRGF